MNKFSHDTEKVRNSKVSEDVLISSNKAKYHNMIKSKAEKYLILGDFKSSISTYTSLIENAKQNNDNILIAKSREGLAISLFLSDLYNAKRNLKEIKYNDAIESNYNEIGSIYKKLKVNEFYIDNMFKLCIYYSLFMQLKTKNFFDLSKRITDEIESMTNITKFNSLLKLHSIYDGLGFLRKSAYFLFQVLFK